MGLSQLKSIDVALATGTKSTSVRVYPAENPSATLILAHGAGAPQSHPWMVAMSELLAARGLDVVTFNFLYADQKKRGGPDKRDVLEATWRAAIAAVRAEVKEGLLFIGGKSMGGRIATQVAADPDVQIDGVVALGYPLHPPGKPEQLRVAHLKDLRAPLLIVQGERDPFGSPAELAPHFTGLKAKVVILPIASGDHSLATPKKSGFTLEQTMARVADAIIQFTNR
jgi:predicted alpha/beta-hydrolase family hydrolase